jgi:hypothetical protein
MMLELTEQQRRLINGETGRPIEVVDPGTQRIYVLIACEQFEKDRALLDAPSSEPVSCSQRAALDGDMLIP